MKIISERNNINELDQSIFQNSLKGKWYHAQRVYVCVSRSNDQTKYTAISLNLFERMALTLHQLLHRNYFSKILGGRQVEILDSTLFPKETQKASKVGQETILPTPIEPKTTQDPATKVEQKVAEIDKKEMEDLSSAIRNIFAVELLYTGLSTPEKGIELDKLIDATSTMEEYLQKHQTQATDNSFDLHLDAFSSHPYLNHFDTLVAVVRRLVYGKKISGYVIDAQASTLKIALSDQSPLVHEASFVNFTKLMDQIDPILKILFSSKPEE